MNDRENAVLSCSCGTWWTQRDIDEYNAGDPGRATERHLSLWKPDGKTHTVVKVGEPA